MYQRKEKETIHELMGHAIELVDKAHPDVDITERRKLYIGPFIRALTDEDQRRAIRMARPKTIEQAAEAALVYESHQRSENQKNTKKKPAVRTVEHSTDSEGKTNSKNRYDRRHQQQYDRRGFDATPVSARNGSDNVMLPANLVQTLIDKIDKIPAGRKIQGNRGTTIALIVANLDTTDKIVRIHAVPDCQIRLVRKTKKAAILWSRIPARPVSEVTFTVFRSHSTTLRARVEDRPGDAEWTQGGIATSGCCQFSSRSTQCFLLFVYSSVISWLIFDIGRKFGVTATIRRNEVSCYQKPGIHFSRNPFE